MDKDRAEKKCEGKMMISIVAKLPGYKSALEQLLSNKTLATDNSKVIFSVLGLLLTSL